jgi:hypothetical protein
MIPFRPGDATFDSGTSFWGTNLTIVSESRAYLELSAPGSFSLTRLYHRRC